MTNLDSGNGTSPNSPLRVLVVEEHPIILKGLTSLLGEDADLEVSGHVSTCAAALQAVADEKPDVIISGLEIEDGEGLDLVAQTAGVPVIILTTCDDPMIARQALQLGARGYILTREHCDNIVRAVKQVARGEVYLCGLMVSRVLHIGGGDDSSQDSLERVLSNRELQVFGFIGQGYNTRQIAEKLGLSGKTIDTYRQHIKTKLGLRENADIAPKAIARVHGTWKHVPRS